VDFTSEMSLADQIVCNDCEQDLAVNKCHNHKCNTFCCDACAQKLHPHHLVLPLPVEPYPLCEEHDENYDSWCKTCKVPVCPRCQMPNQKHQYHAIGPLETKHMQA